MYRLLAAHLMKMKHALRNIAADQQSPASCLRDVETYLWFRRSAIAHCRLVCRRFGPRTVALHGVIADSAN
jgi:hypothetical protein